MENKYTEKEVQTNPSILTKNEDDLLQQRKAINQELDLSQLKIL